MTSTIPELPQDTKKRNLYFIKRQIENKMDNEKSENNKKKAPKSLVLKKQKKKAISQSVA